MIQTEQYIPELKEDQQPSRRISRPPKDRLRPTEYNYTSQKFSKPTTELVRKCGRILSQVQKHEYAVPFLKPVDYMTLNIPDYPLIVKEPMDLSKVEKKLKTGLYSTPMQFAADVRKIWANAILYNPKASPIYTMTVVIRDFFESIYKPVEENPFLDQNNEYLAKRVHKLEKKMDEIVNFSSGGGNPSHETGGEYLERPMSYGEMKALSIGIKSLNSEHFSGIRDILATECPSIVTSDGDIEFDVAKLETRVLRKLERYVKSRQNKAKMEKKMAARKEQKLKAEKDAVEEQVSYWIIQRASDANNGTEKEGFVGSAVKVHPMRKNTEDDAENDGHDGSESSFFTSKLKVT